MAVPLEMLHLGTLGDDDRADYATVQPGEVRVDGAIPDGLDVTWPEDAPADEPLPAAPEPIQLALI